MASFSRRKNYLHNESEHNPFPVKELQERMNSLDWSQVEEKYLHHYTPLIPTKIKEIMGEPDKVFKNQDSREIGPGFSKEFYHELHRFYSQGNRRSGRTHLLARVLVNTAIETGEIIYLNDHHSVFKKDKRNSYHLFEEIRKVIEIYSDKGLSLDYQQEEKDGGYIRVALKGNREEATRMYAMIKNDYTPYNTGINEYPLTPDEAFGTNNKLLLLL